MVKKKLRRFASSTGRRSRSRHAESGWRRRGTWSTVNAASGPELFQQLRAAPPAAVVIDLGRLPSHGRDVGVGVRTSKATRHVPLVFVDGAKAKVAKVRETLPDATFTTWDEIVGALTAALADPR